VLLFEVHVQRVDELPEDLELLVDLGLGLHAGPVEDFRGGEDADAGPNGQGERVGRPGIDGVGLAVPLQFSIVAWKVSSARLETMTRRNFTPSSSSAETNRSWVIGRSGVTPWSRVAMALASHGPIQMGR
jgi:hypothetical protein